TVLYSFPKPAQGSQFGGPLASVTFDGAGQLFGTTGLDDACGGVNYGSVFRLKRIGATWREQDIHEFCGIDGSAPGYGALVLEPAGNFYGTTMAQGGDGHLGVVYELSPAVGGNWTFNVLHDFTFDEGGQPQGGVTLDSFGNLFGTEFAGGLSLHGAVYELSLADGTWNLNVLYEFTGGGSDGTGPWAPPVFDSVGNLFGTTQGGGQAAFCDNCGVVYELAPQGEGQWKESVVYTFGSQPGIADGADPIAGLIRAADGNFYGAADEGGDSSCNCGVVYEFKP
ncbi:MAG TPA: choice-of-anchor tandem repeat GloVer-containing protein, partial [Rhodanobacteraceae bacterium]